MEFLGSAENSDRETGPEWVHSCETGEKRHFGCLVGNAAMEGHDFQPADQPLLSWLHHKVDLFSNK